MRSAKTFLVAVGLISLALMFFGKDGGRHEGNGRPPAERRLIRLASRTVDPACLPPSPSPAAVALSRRGTGLYAVQCASHVSRAVRMQAETLGARILAYLPTDALLVEASPRVVRALLASDAFSAALAYLPTDKVQPGLTGGLVTVMPLAPADREPLIEFIRANGGKTQLVGPSRQGSFRADVSDDLLQKLAACGDVRWLERYVPPKTSNEYATADTGVRNVWDPHGLTGAGQVLSSADSGLDTGVLATLHHDFTNRVVEIANLGGYTTADRCGHGTHTAGTLAGDGTMSDGRHRGVAPEARLYIQACGNGTSSGNIYFDNAETYADIFAAGLAYGSYIHSDSWGDDDRGAYSEFSAGLDEVAWECPELLVVVAAGNSGSGRQTVGSPATAKNALSVGNTYSSRGGRDVTALNSSSSRGPCADGRIKPDITAPGTSIVSARSSLCSWSKYDAEGRYTRQTGTSMATPHVAGCAALVRQWLVERRGYTNAVPTAALVKAILTGGAAGNLPNNDYGFGRLAMEETLFPSNREVRLIDRIPAADGCTIPYRVTTTNAAPLDVQLVWTDYPGDASAACALVNDLDLIVSNRTSGAVWFGNGIVGGDHSNNVESVRIPLADPGDYDVIVRGENVPYPFGEGGAAALYLRGAFSADDAEEHVSLSVSVDGPEGLCPVVSPSVGVYRYPKGCALTLQTGAFAYGTNGNGTVLSRYPYLSLQGSGDVPPSATNETVTVVLGADSAVEWKFAGNPESHLLRHYVCNPGDSWYIFTPGDGSVRNYGLCSADWSPAGSALTVRVPDDLPLGESYEYTGYVYGEHPYYYGTLDMRLGNVELASADEDGFLCHDDKYRLAREIDVTMDGAKDLWAYYYDVRETSDGVLPLWWYCRYLSGSVSQGVIDESAAEAAGDPDGDGFSNAAEYADATDPVDDASFRLKIDAISPTSMTFTGSVKGSLVVERCEALGGLWHAVCTQGPPRTSTTNRVTLTAGGSQNGFYRVLYRAD